MTITPDPDRRSQFQKDEEVTDLFDPSSPNNAHAVYDNPEPLTTEQLTKLKVAATIGTVCFFILLYATGVLPM